MYLSALDGELRTEKSTQSKVEQICHQRATSLQTLSPPASASQVQRSIGICHRNPLREVCVNLH